MGIEGAKSSSRHVTSGVPQGSVLGPLLFLIYTNGLDGIKLSGGSLSMFADDLLLHKTTNFLQDYLNLQADVDALAKWLSDHKLTLNVKSANLS